MLRATLYVIGCLGRYRRMQDGKLAHIFQAVDGKQPLGSTGLKQLEKFVEREFSEALERLCLGPQQEKANFNKLFVMKPRKC